MFSRYFVRFSLMVLALAAFDWAQVSAEGGPGDDLTVTFLEGTAVVADTVVARGAAGTLPASLSSRDAVLSDIMRLDLHGTGDQFVVYEVDSLSGTPVDYGLAIDFLEQSVPGACVDVNPIHGSPSSYPVGTANFPIVAGAGGQFGPDPLQQGLFLRQWAFAQIDYQPGMGAGGGDTLVAVLDAFPAAASGAIPGAAFTHISDVGAPPVAFSQTLPDLADHGLFVTSLAAALAPDATYVGVEVLNDNAIGSLHTLIAGLNWVFTNFPAFGKDHLVINMSLGSDQLDRCNIVVDLLAAGQAAYDVVYIAAAGNGNNDPNAPLPPLYPALLPNVLAIGATTAEGHPTAYSHAGDMLAPGGEAPAGADTCEDPQLCMAGYYVTEPSGPAELASSSGTSFAAPLAAGTAAALFAQPGQDAAGVWSCLLDGAAAHNGILDFDYCQ